MSDDTTGDLFTPPIARNSDPPTSHMAAADATPHAAPGRLKALRLLARYGPMTDYELAALSGLQQNSIGKRRGDCKEVGLVAACLDENGNRITRPAPSGSKAQVWAITQAGIDFVDAHIND